MTTRYEYYFTKALELLFKAEAEADPEKRARLETLAARNWLRPKRALVRSPIKHGHSLTPPYSGSLTTSDLAREERPQVPVRVSTGSGHSNPRSPVVSPYSHWWSVGVRAHAWRGRRAYAGYRLIQ